MTKSSKNRRRGAPLSTIRPTPPRSSGPVGKVLVLDEDPHAASETARVLADAGHDVTAAQTTERGLSLIAEQEFDAVVVDLFAPPPEDSNATSLASGATSGGVDLLERLFAGGVKNVIVVTSRDDVDTAVNALHHGAADYLIKPIEPRRLRISIARALARLTLHAENERLKRDVALFVAGQHLLESLEQDRLVARGLVAFCSFSGASAAAILCDGETSIRGLTEAESQAIAALPLPSGDGGLLRPRDLSPQLERFEDGLALPLGETSWALLLRLPGPNQHNHFTVVERDDARFLSRHFTTALQNANRFLSAEQEARRDPLTGLLNAKTFRAALAEQITQADTGDLFAILFLDIDYFKTVNDNHGHLAGSRLLVELGRTLTQNVRDQDLVARFGGDEFVLLLSGLTLKEADAVAERIRAGVQDQVFDAQFDPVQVTVSIGLACYLTDATDAESLLDKADRALYAAKESTRNTVRHASNL